MKVNIEWDKPAQKTRPDNPAFKKRQSRWKIRPVRGWESAATSRASYITCHRSLMVETGWRIFKGRCALSRSHDKNAPLQGARVFSSKNSHKHNRGVGLDFPSNISLGIEAG